MIIREWTINGLSVELQRDRRTIAKAIGKGNVGAIRADAKAKYYHMADVVNALYDTGELDLVQERAQLAREQTRRLVRENAKADRELISHEEVVDTLQHISKQCVSILEALPLNIKRRVPQLKARDIEYVRLEINKARNLIANVEIKK